MLHLLAHCALFVADGKYDVGLRMFVLAKVPNAFSVFKAWTIETP